MVDYSSMVYLVVDSKVMTIIKKKYSSWSFQGIVQLSMTPDTILIFIRNIQCYNTIKYRGSCQDFPWQLKHIAGHGYSMEDSFVLKQDQKSYRFANIQQIININCVQRTLGLIGYGFIELFLFRFQHLDQLETLTTQTKWQLLEWTSTCWRIVLQTSLSLIDTVSLSRMQTLLIPR